MPNAHLEEGEAHVDETALAFFAVTDFVKARELLVHCAEALLIQAELNDCEARVDDGSLKLLSVCELVGSRQMVFYCLVTLLF